MLPCFNHSTQKSYLFLMPPLSKNISYFGLLVSYFITILLLQSAYAGNPAGSIVLDTDHDGVPDAQDNCPNTLQVYKVDPGSRIAPLFESEHFLEKTIAVAVGADGCAIDSDKDGVPDHRDYCPNDTLQAISKGVTKHGCPLQSDGDGTPDYRDKCPGTLRGIPTDHSGCPKKTHIVSEQAKYPPQVKEMILETKALVKTIDMDGFRKIVANPKGLMIVDVREPKPFAAGHVTGAINIPRGILELKIWKHVGFPDKTDYNKKIYFYCDTGPRAIMATKRLQEFGFTDVTTVLMTIEGWAKAGHPFIK